MIVVYVTDRSLDPIMIFGFHYSLGENMSHHIFSFCIGDALLFFQIVIRGPLIN